MAYQAKPGKRYAVQAIIRNLDYNGVDIIGYGSSVAIATQRAGNALGKIIGSYKAPHTALAVDFTIIERPTAKSAPTILQQAPDLIHFMPRGAVKFTQCGRRAQLPSVRKTRLKACTTCPTCLTHIKKIEAPALSAKEQQKFERMFRA